MFTRCNLCCCPVAVLLDLKFNSYMRLITYYSGFWGLSTGWIVVLLLELISC
uniref:Uncharacterized protein n=1 Tax=Arundo donax TaxID=35708 RepID=A0A0A9FS02_ARUDO